MVPSPDDSFAVRLATLLAGVLALASGIVAAVQLHWAALVCLPVGAAAMGLWGWSSLRVRRGTPLIRLTDAAAKQLTAMIAHEPDPARSCFRIRIDGEFYDVGFVTGHDPRSELMVQSQGVRIVLLESQAAQLQGMEVDFREVPGMGKGFLFSRASSESAGG